ncbi:hypothetical protein C2U72_01825 [Prosthecomicrobium hirschii]|uniref:hypothetical protein n=1 Tax=Prosthecodimorpha hirschii TaxID=665126 RepID=UPI00112C3DB9|nr:hypothetical protein [Prosthecomicrobium hirschii]TPQ52700.1 hypothetical protein C2U72_01825 [Prosthecomicrobium hirschii]
MPDISHLAHIARGAMPDRETQTELILIKLVSFLRLTYQIRLLTYRAAKEKKNLILVIPTACTMSGPLIEHIIKHRKIFKLVRKEWDYT